MKSKMRITAGIARADQYPLYLEAGADEVFCGYVPEMRTQYPAYPMNRREVKYCPVQLGGRNELRLLAGMVRKSGAPAVLAFNSTCYHPKQLDHIADLVEECLEDGFRSFIIADPALMLTLSERNLLSKISLHISGETGEINRYVLAEWKKMGADRIIFHRKVGLKNMASLIRTGG